MTELLIVNPRPRHDNIALALRVLFANEERYDLTGSAVRHIVYCVSGRDVGRVNVSGTRAQLGSGWTKAGWTTGFRGQLGKLWQYVEPRQRLLKFVNRQLQEIPEQHVIAKCVCATCVAIKARDNELGAKSYRYVTLTDDGRARYYERCALSAEELLAYHADAWLPNAQRYRRTRDAQVQRARTA